MANPQLEQGYTRIANEIMDALAKYQLNGTQWRILIVVFRYTYGFARKDHDLSETFISNITGIHRKQIGRELSVLIKNKLLIVKKPASFTSSRILAFNKDYESWEGVSTKTLTGDKNATPNELVELTGSGLVDPTGNGLVDHIKKYTKEKINKGYIDDFFEEVWQQYPKKKGKGQVSKAQKEKLYKIGRDEIFRAIERYKKETTGRDHQYIMYGSTFFNSGYIDYLDKNYDQGSHHQQSGGDNTYGYQDFTGRFRD
jgi:phage replication O-like protein O